MDNVIFEGSAKLCPKDFMEAEKLVLGGRILGVLLKLCLAYSVFLIFLGLICFVMLPYSDNLTAYDGVKCVLFGGIMTAFLIFVYGRSGRQRAGAPINRDRSAHITLCADRLIYSDEFIRYNCAYSDFARVRKGRTVYVLEFSSGYILIPLRCFGEADINSVTAFLRERING